MTDEYERHEASPLEAELERHRQALHSAADALDARRDNLVMNAALLQGRIAQLKHVAMLTGVDVPGLQAAGAQAQALQAEARAIGAHAPVTAALTERARRISEAEQAVHAVRTEEDPTRRAELARMAQEQLALLK